MKKILLITTLYPDPLRPGTEVCHYFAREWVAMGYQLLVINYRSMFPRIYTDLAGLFPKLAERYIGNRAEMDRNQSVIQHEVEGIPVYSIPIFKYVPHGRYPKRVIRQKVEQLENILRERNFVPDAIIGHFHNPQFEIIGALKTTFPSARTCVSLHELGAEVLKKCYGRDCERVLNGVDMIGFRSLPIKKRFEACFGHREKSLICWSGVPAAYTETPLTDKKFKDGMVTKFLYVGQTIPRKFPKETIEGIHLALGDADFHLTYVGSEDIAYEQTRKYIDKHQLVSKVDFVGECPRQEIIHYYDENECFILISRHEVFGLVCLEAMSRGCLTIASRDEGMEGIIEDGKNGFLCEAGNAKELASIICRIGKMTAEEKYRMSTLARQTALALSDHNVAKNYIDAVLSL